MVSAASEIRELYRDHQSSVSRYWLLNGKSRYAVNTFVKLEFHTITRPRVRAGFILLLGIALTLSSVRYIVIGAQPNLIPLIMLTGSMILMAGGSCALYLARVRFRIDLTLLNGSEVSLQRKKKVEAENLHAGLSEAMDWHRHADPDLGSLPRINRSRQGVVCLPDKQTAEPRQGKSTLQTVVRRPVIGPVVTTERADLKAQIAPLYRLFSTWRLRRPVD